jgi:hypothetical protein
MTFAIFTSCENENKRTATAVLLSGGSQVIVWFDLWEFYGNSETVFRDVKSHHQSSVLTKSICMEFLVFVINEESIEMKGNVLGFHRSSSALDVLGHLLI